MRVSTQRSLALLTLCLAFGAFLWGVLATGNRAADQPGPVELKNYAPTPEQLREAYQRAGRTGPSRARVYKDKITPHWFLNNTRFWYRNELAGGASEFILVDAEAGTRQAAFDHPKLAAALSKAAGKEYRPDRLPFDSIEFVDDKAVRFKVGDTTWK